VKAQTEGPFVPAWQKEDWQGRGAKLSVAVEAAGKARHGRVERRELWALYDPQVNDYVGSSGVVGQAWPHLRQVCRLERRREMKGRSELKVSYAISSLLPTKADAQRLLRLRRGYWGIENRLHWVRDVTWDEDRSQVRTGAAPQVMAACRNLAIGLLRRTQATNIAAALRTYAARPHMAVALVLAGGLG
jgi:predicted transposase YbfD/YdcC